LKFSAKGRKKSGFMRVLRHLSPLVLLLVLAACRDEKVTFYRVPKEADPALPGVAAAGSDATGSAGMPAAGGGSMADTAVPTAAGPGLTWTAPPGWRVKPASAMRKGSYAVPGEGGAEADFSITAFPGDVGGELANVNRWRGQVQLPPLSDGDLAGAVGTLAQNGLQFELVDFAGDPGAGGKRILGAIVPFADGTWFFKLTGPDRLVEGEKAAFLGFLKSVKPATQP
jgi:hypothetical protein